MSTLAATHAPLPVGVASPADGRCKPVALTFFTSCPVVSPPSVPARAAVFSDPRPPCSPRSPRQQQQVLSRPSWQQQDLACCTGQRQVKPHPRGQPTSLLPCAPGLLALASQTPTTRAPVFSACSPVHQDCWRWQASHPPPGRPSSQPQALQGCRLCAPSPGWSQSWRSGWPAWPW